MEWSGTGAAHINEPQHCGLNIVIQHWEKVYMEPLPGCKSVGDTTIGAAADRRDYLRDYKIRLYAIIEGLFGIIFIRFPWSNKNDL